MSNIQKEIIPEFIKKAIASEVDKAVQEELTEAQKRIEKRKTEIVALGAGKTTFSQSVGKALGIKETMTSPTFVIEKIYETAHPIFKRLVHIDAYRLESGAVKTEQDYRDALKSVEELMNLDPNPESVEGEQLTLLTTLIQEYESRILPQSLPTPVEAIRFRMEQADLKPTDLIPYIGSRSRVSEVLSGKRPLTLEMIRALETGLGIPAKVLIQKIEANPDSKYERWDIRLVKLMDSRGYFGKKTLKNSTKSDLLDSLFTSLGSSRLQPAALLRKTSYRSAILTNKDALLAWQIRVVQKADKMKVPIKYKHGTLDISFMRDLIKLSVEKDGPKKAIKKLADVGIKLIIEPHLPKTHLDGAAILTEKDNPIIGLTLRHDRLDNFWFTLLHELAHVIKHYGGDFDSFFDEKLQDKKGVDFSSQDKEDEADELAEEAILPKAKWEISSAKVIPSAMAAQSLANELGVHISVVAGIIRFKHQNYYYLNKIVTDEESRVQWLFPDIFVNK